MIWRSDEQTSCKMVPFPFWIDVNFLGRIRENPGESRIPERGARLFQIAGSEWTPRNSFLGENSDFVPEVFHITPEVFFTPCPFRKVLFQSFSPESLFFREELFLLCQCISSLSIWSIKSTKSLGLWDLQLMVSLIPAAIFEGNGELGRIHAKPPRLPWKTVVRSQSWKRHGSWMTGSLFHGLWNIYNPYITGFSKFHPQQIQKNNHQGPWLFIAQVGSVFCWFFQWSNFFWLMNPWTFITLRISDWMIGPSKKEGFWILDLFLAGFFWSSKTT